jgi:hypothetical protein
MPKNDLPRAVPAPIRNEIEHAEYVVNEVKPLLLGRGAGAMDAQEALAVATLTASILLAAKLHNLSSLDTKEIADAIIAHRDGV